MDGGTNDSGSNQDLTVSELVNDLQSVVDAGEVGVCVGDAG